MEKLMQNYYYLKSVLLFDQAPGPDIVLDRTQLKMIIVHALKTLHGEVGAAIQVDVIKCEPDTSSVSAILRVPNKYMVKVWSALTLLGCYENRVCAFQITKVSACLMGLAADSRHFNYTT